MNPLALEKAQRRLRSAQRAYTQLSTAPVHEGMEDHWLDFLHAWKGCYQKIQQAAKDTPQELQWFGSVNRERKGDPLLLYLFEARNDEEHSVTNSASLQPHRQRFRLNHPGGEVKISLVHGPDNRVAHAFDGRGNKLPLVEETPEKRELHPVTARGHRVIPVPTSHQGKPIQPQPAEVALLGLRWLEALVAKADEMRRP